MYLIRNQLKLNDRGSGKSVCLSLQFLSLNDVCVHSFFHAEFYLSAHNHHHVHG